MSKPYKLYLVTRQYDFLVIKDVVAYGFTEEGIVYYKVQKDDGLCYRQFFNKDQILYMGNDKQTFDQLIGRLI